LNTFKSFVPEIYEVNDQSFADIALELFRFQARNNELYATFLSTLGVDPGQIISLEQIPFMPVSFFKTHTIRTASWVPETTFLSSATTGTRQSRHDVASLTFYLENATRCFGKFFGPLTGYHVLALLPSYLERQGSSLISMIRHFIDTGGSRFSGFYLNEDEKLLRQLEMLRGGDRKVILWGVSFALLDLVEKYQPDLSHCLVFETGGMKGRRREITRQELHLTLRQKLNCPAVFSEYGMTELLSQAYTTGALVFYCPDTMRVIGRDMSDPMLKGLINETCGLNIIDLANWQTISFIETEDVGKVFADGTFEVLGRLDNSEIRGCNLMV
jgi:hypothetical protein